MAKSFLAIVLFATAPFTTFGFLSAEEEEAILAKLKGTWIVTKSKGLPSTAQRGKVVFDGRKASVDILWPDGAKSEWEAYFNEIDQDRIYVGARTAGEKGLVYKLRGDTLHIEWMLRFSGAKLEDVTLERVDRLKQKAEQKKPAK